ncbi:MAG: flagellar basal body L-ring protein FlgH [Gammaproteobacteria bacterium]|nr:flagellar basal body L-ring protein FlgH [Gammaproteobacteria bacterium]MBU1443355.1 flagellar basal body L-ring protein FlgH [Gammaproteobacteria bacterium]MBU2286150.1 flagellar basal body L-ring protein FlgH [Gammaproteobacteria bacterium]
MNTLSLRLAAFSLFGALCVFATGCSTIANTPQVDMPATTPPPVTTQPIAAPKPVTGSLFRTVSYRPLFEDRRARMVGDNVTIVIVENVSASQKSTSTIDKKSGIDSSISAVPFLSANSFGRASATASNAQNFAGKGGTESANTFQGSITATVVDVLPNGHLMVTGEKQIGVNQNVDVLRFSGTIDPRAIQAGSSVSSTQVANVRIESRGRGAQQESQVMPWLNRFFMSVLPF